MASTVGVGRTVILKSFGVPVHVVPAFVNVGVTVIVPNIEALVELSALNPGILPILAEPKLILVLVFVQLYAVPDTPPLKLTGLD